MDRKGIIAVVLSLVILVWWQWKTQKEFQAWKAQQQQIEAAASPTPEGTPGETAIAATSPDAPTAATPSAQSPAAPLVPEQTTTITNASAEYRITNHGGGIRSIKLLKHEGEKEGEQVILGTEGRFPIGAIFDDPASTERLEAYTIREEEGGKVIAERVTPQGIKITKVYHFAQPGEGEDEYAVPFTVTFTNQSEVPFEKAAYHLSIGSTAPLHKDEYTYYTGLDWHRDLDTEFVDIHWFDASTIPLTGIERSPAKTLYSEMPGNIAWAAVKNQYFTSLISTLKNPANGVVGRRFDVKVDGKPMYGLEGALVMPVFKLAPGASVTQEFRIYAGPKEYRRLAQLGQGESELMHFGIFKLICIFLLKAMNWLEGYLGSYALAIIVLTFIVRGLLWPVQGKATTSMKRMQLLQPKMAELREKYKDDPTKMNQELMGLYKTYGINPFAGCLPMLIQIPIFFGFYSMLGTAVELRNSHFLWVNDLSHPDTIATIFGFPINILPLLMAGTMVLQMQLTPKSGDALQQRIFMFMPLIFVVFTYNFASALALYYTVQNILSIIQLFVTRNEPMPELVRRDEAPKKNSGKKRK